MSELNLTHWSYQVDEENIAWVTLDRQGASVNTFNEVLMSELNDLIEHLKKQDSFRAIVFRSGKKTGFIAGADIDIFETFKDAEDATSKIRLGQKIFDKLEALKSPTIAMISGFCLGGGLEFALACRYRIAEASDKTRLGLPEVNLGVHPGWGGTVRLPKLIGATNAFDLILSGRFLSAKAAYKMGVVDAAVPLRLFEQVVRHFARHLPPPHQPSPLQKLTNNSLVRIPLAFMIGRKLQAKAKRSHYPAPYAVIDHWVEHGVHSDRAFEVEAKSFGRLLMSDTSGHLVGLFFLQDKLKGLAKSVDFSVKHVHVIGAGVMGAGIAAWCAKSGLKVTIQDQNPEVIGRAVKEAHQLACKKLKDADKIMSMMDRFIPDVEGLGIASADVIIEAVSENVALKQQIFAMLESKAKPGAILATNTSTICLERIAEGMSSPERLVGIHFFNPVSKMPLVEIVSSKETDQTVCDQATVFVKRIGKLPLPVKSAPGFLVNRILMPYMLEAVSLLEEGVDAQLIDAAAMSFGMPMGPITLADTVGLDVCLHALTSMQDVIGEPVPEALKQKVASGHLGIKSNRGYYTYKNGKRVDKKKKFDVVPKDVIDRLVLRLLNEAIAARREGIVNSDDMLDAGSVFGFGFPPFRGGIMTYIKEQGLPSITAQLNEFMSRYGARFKADAGWTCQEELSSEEL